MVNIALLASPGVGSRLVREQLLRALPDMGLHDVDDELIRQEHLWLNARLRSVPAQARSIRSLIEGLTRDALLNYWNEAYQGIIDHIVQNKVNTNVVSFHPSYYSSRRSEFYSTLAFPISQRDDLRFSHIILLIDDIYDIQRRLGGKNDIFDLKKRLDRHLLSQRLDVYQAAKGELPDHMGETWESFRSENLNAVLSDIATWRRFDMVQAELLARAHDCKLTVLGVKHPFRSLVELIKDPNNSKTAYLSHPISRPRRAVLAGTVADWPEVVLSSNRLGDRLASEGVDLVMPTSIDEFRIMPAPDETRPYERPYRLGKRWPDLSPTGAIVPNESPADLAVLPDLLTELKLGTHARGLEKMIIGEVPFRDHFLVSNTDSFFVYRPLFGVKTSESTKERGGSFSGGVQAEIDHWVDSWDSQSFGTRKRRALFTHCLSDIEEIGWLWAGNQPQNINERKLHVRGVEQALRSHLREEYGLKRFDIENVLQGEPLREDMLDAAVMDASHDAGELRVQAYETAGKSYLVQYLSGGIERQDVLDSGDVGIFLVDGEELFDNDLRECAAFLRGESSWPTLLLDQGGVLERGLGVAAIGEWVEGLLAPS
ncbi:hypothetical protein J7E83_11795 [Arthrobacter sp. ISL-48]|uniref:hypothetical protein n=1 Tax=Arthrobacter sp. ISL-48 TaxID=2819110 RepID=UPI001BED0BB7|nr:hypothetical protein [Arthrobacter sp. ISL-48]MBT2532793.1 hypothetical protein [Arthrobacter sp. ISL-48]